MSLRRLREAIQNDRVSFPSQVPTLARQSQGDMQWRLVQLYFVRNWSFPELGERFGLKRDRVRQILFDWVRRAIVLGYLQEIPALAAPTINTFAPDTPRFPTRHGRIIRSPEGDIRLTPTESGILEHLSLHLDQTVRRTELVKILWGANPQKGVHNLRAFIQRLRQKLEPDPTRPIYLITEPTIGYRLRIPLEDLSKCRHASYQPDIPNEPVQDGSV